MSSTPETLSKCPTVHNEPIMKRGMSHVALDNLSKIDSKGGQNLAALATLAEKDELLPLRRPLPKSEPFPLDALPPVLRGMVERVVESIQPPVALAGQSILAAATLAVQPLANVSIDGRSYPLSCFFVTVGESGERKSATDAVALSPHRKHEKAIADTAKTATLDYIASLEEWKKGKDQIIKSGKDIKQSLIRLGPEPSPPLDGQVITEEPTYEGIFKLLQHGQPSIGIFSAEGGRFLGGYAMGKDNQLKTVAGLSSLWDGSPLTRTRSGDGNCTLYGRRCSLHLMLQPIIANDLFSNNMLIGQGLLSRCLVAYPDSTIGYRPYQGLDISLTAEGRKYLAVMTDLLEMPLPLVEGQRNELKPNALSLSPRAKVDWVGYHNHVESLAQEGRDLFDIRGFATKAAEHAIRLAGVLTLVEDSVATTISEHNMVAGINLSQFYVDEALRLFHTTNDDEELVLAEKCLEWAKKNRPRFSLPCLYQSGPSKVRNKKKAQRIVDILIVHNRIRPLGGSCVIEGIKRRVAWEVIG